MRVFVLAAMLLASSSLGSFAQEQGNAPPAGPQAGPPAAQADQNSQPPRDQKADRTPPKTDDREMGPDWRMRRGDGDRMSRGDREADRDGMMRRGDRDRIGRDDREMGHGGMIRRDDRDRGRYQERGDRDRDDAYRDRGYSGYDDADRPRRRVKVCVEYENGDEYCRYRQ